MKFGRDSPLDLGGIKNKILKLCPINLKVKID